jgi:hypothetical protein
VGLYAGIRQHFTMGDARVTACMVQDVMTHPDYRGRGFLHHLSERCLSEINEANEIGYTFPNEKSERSFRRNGWNELCRVPWRRTILGEEVETKKVTLTAVEGDLPADISTLWQESGIQFGVERSRDYFSWRYSKPKIKYLKFLVNDSAGLLVLKFYRSGDSVTAHICDLLVRDSDRILLPEILTFCRNFSRQHGCQMLTAWLPEGHPYAWAYNKLGLRIDQRANRFVFVHPGRVGLAGISEAGNWQLTQGDSDVY